MAGDKVGQAGVESAFDAYLRGTPGVQPAARELARHSAGVGRPGAAAAVGQRGPSDARPPAAGGGAEGAHVRDPARARLELLRLLGRERRRDRRARPARRLGARARVRADVQPRRLLRPRDDEEARGAGADRRTPRRRRTIRRSTVRSSASYPPGSTFKPVTALAAMQQHLVSPYAPEACTGTYTAPEDRGHQVFKNWDPYVNAADRPADRARDLVRHLLLRSSETGSTSCPRATAIRCRRGRAASVSAAGPASTWGRRRAGCCRRPSGGSGRSPRKRIRAAGASTASGSPATRSSSRSGRRTCWSRRCRWRASTR